MMAATSYRLSVRNMMKITKRQLRRIIKEEKSRLVAQRAAAPYEGGAYDDVHDTVFQLLDQELTRLGHDRFSIPEVAEDVANALEDIAREVREEIGTAGGTRPAGG